MRGIRKAPDFLCVEDNLYFFDIGGARLYAEEQCYMQMCAVLCQGSAVI